VKQLTEEKENMQRLHDDPHQTIYSLKQFNNKCRRLLEDWSTLTIWLPCEPSVLSSINGTVVAVVLLATDNVNEP